MHIGDYRPPPIPTNYPFMHRGWFLWARDYNKGLKSYSQLGQAADLEKEAGDLFKKLLVTATVSGVVGFLAIKYLM